MALHAWVYGCYQSHSPLGPLEPVARSETTEVWIRGYASRPTYENNASSRSGEGTLAITWFLSSPKAASVITAPSSFSYSRSLSETAGACGWQCVRTQREKKLIISSDVRDSELENIRLAVSYLCAITDLTTFAGVSCCRGGNVKARYTAPTRKDCMASAIWLAVSTSWPSHYNSKMGLDRCHLSRNLIVALSPWESIPFHSEFTIDFPLFSLQKTPKKKLYNDSIQADIKLLIWTNITHTHKKSKLSPNSSLDPPHPFVKNNYDPSAVDKTLSRIYQSFSTHHATSNLFFGRRGHIFRCYD